MNSQEDPLSYQMSPDDPPRKVNDKVNSTELSGKDTPAPPEDVNPPIITEPGVGFSIDNSGKVALTVAD